MLMGPETEPPTRPAAADWAYVPVDPEPAEGISFLKTMFCETKTMVEPNAQMRPRILEAEMSNEHASMTPRVRGRSERYVAGE